MLKTAQAARLVCNALYRSLQFNHITSLATNAFTGLTSLTQVTLQNNNITNIVATTFTGLSSVTQTDLSYNKLTSLSANAFTDLSALTQLDLSYNMITSLSANTFTGLSALTRLDLSYNMITSLSANTFTGLSALTQLYLFENQITSIPADAFAGLTALTQLFLFENQITSIPADAFAGLTALTQLELSHTRITSISANAFRGLTALTALYLHSVQLNSIPANAFTDLPTLQRLALNDNPLTTLPPGLFKGLPNGLALSSSAPFLSSNNFTFGGNTVAPPSTYGSVFQPLPCGTACATCYSAGSCCGINCLTCTSNNSCTLCYEGYVAMGDYCLASAATNASIASAASSASVASTQSASAASIASLVSATSALSASAASTASASDASIASRISASSALSASAASTASASAASVASSIAQFSGGAQTSSPVVIIAAAAGASAAVIVILVLVFVMLRRRRSQRADMPSKDSAGPIYQEAVEMAISPQNHSARSHKEDDVPATASISQNQPEPVYEDFSSHTTEEFYDNESPYVAGSNSRRVREGLTIVKHLASGNFGDVALGRVPFGVLSPRAQVLLGRKASSEVVQVAVKSLKSHADEQSRKDFESEAKLMAPFVHPNVVRLLAALVESEPHLVLLEFVQYGDLRTLLQKSKKKSLSWTHNEQVHAIRQIALGMEYLGTLHFVHRDLAARNCLVGQGMVVKIADFGLSRELTENDYYRMQTRGKLPVKWMAPETMTFRKFSTMSDVWSFGVTAWECCSYGETPYGQVSGRETLVHVEAGGRLPMSDTCMPELYNMMMSCWNATPDFRPTFAQLAKVLTSLQDGTTIREIGAMV
ncbi:TKL protein kinase, variant 2 [Capsaspora owczarzaki ATCC 30864]|uniref:TKL protein kinase, variant 2 n=1 Tax=Capsaspora owczarzaki (strain ATCC 30864) TaxID=595528 RepID=A0A0D2X375_CAPO3|nr:TKL protein kinase, variant 2 [Capsaspora owczarzaki ATCC 30864]